MIAHNLANATTPAFKAERIMFAELVQNSVPGERMSYVTDMAAVLDMREGELKSTGNPLDLAINGDGFFVVRTPEGSRYTRNGQFRLDADGTVVTGGGHAVLGETGQPIAIPPGDSQVEVGRDGHVASESGPIGRLSIVRFEAPENLEPVSGGLYRALSPAIPAPEAVVAQGMTELSNVQPVLETTALIEASRTYQALQRLIDNEHERQLKAISVLTGTQ